MKNSFTILFLSLFFVFGCDIFESRDPEQPNQSRSNYDTPSEPQIVIQNLKNAFSDKNADNYRKNFASGPPLVDRNFFFLPTNQALSRNPNLWAGWTTEDEFQYFNNLIIRTPEELPITLSLFSENYSPLGDSTIYTAEYSINVPNLSGAPDIYEGSLKFSMITDNQAAWIIYYWEDITKENNRSWSDLKIESHL
jgi:hypothetical protein